MSCTLTPPAPLKSARQRNSAPTAIAPSTVLTQSPVPAHPPPLHPANAHPLAGCACSVSDVPLGKSNEHTDPHAIPAGTLVTVPEPVTPTVTVKLAGAHRPAVHADASPW